VQCGGGKKGYNSNRHRRPPWLLNLKSQRRGKAATTAAAKEQSNSLF